MKKKPEKPCECSAEKGVDGYKFFERLSPQVAKAAAEEAHRLGRPVFAHSLDIFVAADAGYQSVEHSWSVAYTSIQDPKKKAELDSARMNRKITTAEVHAYMEPEMFDRIIKAMVAKNIHWSPTWGTTFRALSPRAQQMKQHELTLLKDPNLRYLPPYILKASESISPILKTHRPRSAASFHRLQEGPGFRPAICCRRRQDPFGLRSR